MSKKSENSEKLYAVFYNSVYGGGRGMDLRRVIDAQALDAFEAGEPVAYGQPDRAVHDVVAAGSVSDAVRTHLSKGDTSPLRHEFSVYVFDDGHARARRRDFEQVSYGSHEIRLPRGVNSGRFAMARNIEEALRAHGFGEDGWPLEQDISEPQEAQVGVIKNPVLA